MRRTRSATPPPELQQALDWLAEPAGDDPLLDLVPLRKHVSALAALDIPAAHRLKIDELLQQRADRVDQALMPLLLDAKLPLPAPLATVAQGLGGLRAELGATWLRIAAAAKDAELKRIRRSRVQVCLYGMFNLSRQFIATQLAATPTPMNLWRNAQALYHLAHDAVDPEATLPVELNAIDVRLKAMLALTAAQPECLAPREIAFLGDYLEAHAAHVRIDPLRPTDAADWYWLDAALDHPPVPLSRLQPYGERCLFVRHGELAELATRHLERLNDGVPPLSMGLPLQAAGADYRNALERARQCWASPRHRSFNRRRSQDLTVAVCTQLSSLWSELHGSAATEAAATECALTYSDWMLLNESPSGYAIVHVVGEISGIVAGCAVGLRTTVGAEWQICLVRWARSRPDGHLELGLEVLAPSARPVRIQTLGTRRTEAQVPALLLPALPKLKRGEAILAARGDYNARPFALLQEISARIKVIECRPQRTLVETSSVEVFEFARNA